MTKFLGYYWRKWKNNFYYSRPALPFDLIRTPLNVASGVLKINKNFNKSLVMKNQKVLDPFYK